MDEVQGLTLLMLFWREIPDFPSLSRTLGYSLQSPPLLPLLFLTGQTGYRFKLLYSISLRNAAADFFFPIRHKAESA